MYAVHTTYLQNKTTILEDTVMLYKYKWTAKIAFAKQIKKAYRFIKKQWQLKQHFKYKELFNSYTTSYRILKGKNKTIALPINFSTDAANIDFIIHQNLYCFNYVKMIGKQRIFIELREE